MNSPDFENLSTPLVYINQLDQSSSYLSMRSPGINSPTPDNTTVFNFDIKKKKISNASSKFAPQDDVFIEEEEYEETKNVDIESTEESKDAVEVDSTGFTNPSYLYPPKNDTSPKLTDCRQSSDKYILMAHTDNLQNFIEKKNGNQEKLYLNDLPLV